MQQNTNFIYLLNVLVVGELTAVVLIVQSPDFFIFLLGEIGHLVIGSFQLVANCVVPQGQLLVATLSCCQRFLKLGLLHLHLPHFFRADFLVFLNQLSYSLLPPLVVIFDG